MFGHFENTFVTKKRDILLTRTFAAEVMLWSELVSGNSSYVSCACWKKIQSFKGISMLQTKCLSNRQRASGTDNHTYFPQQLPSCVEVRKYAGLVWLSVHRHFHSLHNFHHFSWVQPSATPRMPLRRNCCCVSIQILLLIQSLSSGQLETLYTCLRGSLTEAYFTI